MALKAREKARADTAWFHSSPEVAAMAAEDADEAMYEARMADQRNVIDLRDSGEAGR